MPVIYNASLQSCCVGIDPGASGGISYIRPDKESVNGTYAVCMPMPETKKDIWTALFYIKSYCEAEAIPCLVCLEKVGGFINAAVDGVQGPRNVASGHGMFAFGKNVGFLEGCLVGLNIDPVEVIPKRWQGMFGLKRERLGDGTNKKESTSHFKNRIKAKAQSLFPQLNVTLKTADSLLLAEYCRRMVVKNG